MKIYPLIVLSSALFFTACGSVTNRHEENSKVLSETIIQNGSLHESETLQKLKDGQSIPLTSLIKDKSIQQNLSSQLGKDIDSLMATVPVKNHRDLLSSDDLLLAFDPDSKDTEEESITAYDLNGRKKHLSRKKAPRQPVVAIKVDKRKEVAKLAEAVNKKTRTGRGTAEGTEANSTYCEKLNSISYNRTSDSWFDSTPALYALATYLDKSGSGAVNLVELPEVDEADTTYEVNKCLHYWNPNKYQVVDIAFMEHASSYDFREIAQFLLKAVGDISEVIFPNVPFIQLITKTLSSAVSTLTQNAKDEFVDSKNTVEKYKTYRGSLSTRGIIKGELVTFAIPYNDE